MDTHPPDYNEFSPMHHGPIAYDINTFCRIFSVGRTLTYAEIKAGRLKIAKIGRRTVIPAVEAETWFKQKCV